MTLSSVHVTFALEQDAAALTGKDWLLRNDIQFHWFNDGYESFDALPRSTVIFQAEELAQRAAGGARYWHRVGSVDG